MVRAKPAVEAATEVQEVQMPALRVLACDGTGVPGGAQFEAAIQALYATAYTLKMRRKADGADFRVPPLEALWWVSTDGKTMLPRQQWTWRLLLEVPAGVSKAELKRATETLAKRHPEHAARGVRLERLHEGRCVQALRIGPYENELVDLRRIDAYIEQHHLRRNGPHHEVYLSDPRRTPPARLRTILRAPVAAA